eukprot:Opistho-2@40816
MCVFCAQTWSPMRRVFPVLFAIVSVGLFCVPLLSVRVRVCVCVFDFLVSRLSLRACVRACVHFDVSLRVHIRNLFSRSFACLPTGRPHFNRERAVVFQRHTLFFTL